MQVLTSSHSTDVNRMDFQFHPDSDIFSELNEYRRQVSEIDCRNACEVNDL